MQTITISTKPISVNQLYRGKRFLTRDGAKTKNAMAWEVKSQWHDSPLETPVALTIRFYFDSHRPDIDGCVKALLDSLQGILWVNDRLIEELHIYKYKDKNNPRTEIEIH